MGSLDFLLWQAMMRHLNLPNGGVRRGQEASWDFHLHQEGTKLTVSAVRTHGEPDSYPPARLKVRSLLLSTRPGQRGLSGESALSPW